MHDLNHLGRGLLASPTRLWAWAIFLFALGAHAGYIVDVRLHPDNGYIDFHRAQGSPFFDAAMWHEMGLEIASGWGWHTWSGRRPVYGWFLAVLYTLVGVEWSYAAALAANVVFIALATALFFLALRRLYGDLIAACVAGSIALSDQAFMCSSVTLSEGLGLFFLAWHFWLLVAGVQQQRLTLLAYSGALLALSNATRTLTLLATPLYVLALWWLLLRQGAAGRRALWAGALFLLTTASVTLGFMLQNYLRVGIFSLSDNTAGDLYAVTAPEYGHWTPEVMNRIVAEQKIWQTRDLYKYQMRLAKQHLRERPGLFLSRFVGHVRAALAHLSTYDGPWLAAFLVLGSLLWPVEEPRLGAQGRWTVALLAAVAVCFAPVRGALLALGLVWGLAGMPRRESQLLAALFMGTLLAVGLFGSSMERLFLMFQWSSLGLQLGALGHGLAWLHGSRYRQWRQPVSLAPLAWRPPAWVWQLALAPLALASVLVMYRNTAAVRPYVPTSQLQPAYERLVQAAVAREPNLFTAEERANAQPQAEQPPDVSAEVIAERHGRLAAVCALVEPQAYYFMPRSQRAPMSNLALQVRPYERTVLRLAVRRHQGPLLPVFALAPGDLRWLGGHLVCILGRVHAGNAAQEFVEVLGWCPWSDDGAALDVRSLRFTTDEPEHRRVLRELVETNSAIKPQN